MMRHFTPFSIAVAVAAYLPNIPEAIIGLLATASLAAVGGRPSAGAGVAGLARRGRWARLGPRGSK